MTKNLTISYNQIQKKDIPILGVCLFGLIYFGYGEPRLLSVFAVSMGGAFITLESINLIVKVLFRKRIALRIWHYLAIALGISLCFTTFEAPSHALLFEALEQSTVDMLEATGGAVEEGTITALFIFFRVVVVLAFVGGAIAGVVQALQGSDWRPIANMMGIGVGLVLVIEILTNLVVGGGAAA